MIDECDWVSSWWLSTISLWCFRCIFQQRVQWLILCAQWSARDFMLTCQAQKIDLIVMICPGEISLLYLWRIITSTNPLDADAVLEVIVTVRNSDDNFSRLCLYCQRLKADQCHDGTNMEKHETFVKSWWLKTLFYTCSAILQALLNPFHCYNSEDNLLHCNHRF